MPPKGERPLKLAPFYVVYPSRWMLNLSVALATVSEDAPETLEFLVENFQVTYHLPCKPRSSLLVCEMVVQPDMQVEVGVSGLPVYSTPQ